MEILELKTKSKEELKRLLALMREKLRDSRFKNANKQLKDVRLIREVKKTIARILTLLHRK